MLMATGDRRRPGDVLWFLIVVGAASTLVAMATSYRDAPVRASARVCLALDSAIVGFTTALLTIVGGEHARRVGGGSAASCWAPSPLPATPSPSRLGRRSAPSPRGRDALFLGGVLVLCLNAAGEAARADRPWRADVLAAPGVALFGALGLARSAWRGPRLPPDAEAPPPRPSRACSLVPAVAAAAPSCVLSLGSSSRAAASRAGVLRHHHAVRPDRRPPAAHAGREPTAAAARRAVGPLRGQAARPRRRAGRRARPQGHARAGVPHGAVGAGAPIRSPVDARPEQRGARGGRSAERQARVAAAPPPGADDPTSLAVRVARTGAAEIVSNVPSANAEQRLPERAAARPGPAGRTVVHGGRVQGVLVCVDARIRPRTASASWPRPSCSPRRSPSPSTTPISTRCSGAAWKS